MSKHESRKTRRKQLVENNLSKTTRRKELVENTRRKTCRKASRQNFPAENSSQEQKIISEKYSANFVIVLCCEVLNYYEVFHASI